MYRGYKSLIILQISSLTLWLLSLSTFLVIPFFMFTSLL